MHVPAFWCDGNLLFYSGIWGWNLKSKHGLGAEVLLHDWRSLRTGARGWVSLSVRQHGSLARAPFGFCAFFLRAVLQDRSFCGHIIVVEKKMPLEKRGVKKMPLLHDWSGDRLIGTDGFGDWAFIFCPHVQDIKKARYCLVWRRLEMWWSCLWFVE
jgi:hypothetical protein